MLHYAGDITGMELSLQARHYIWMYHKPDEEEVKVPYMDLVKRKKRYVKFERLTAVSDWVFVDLVD